MVSGDIFLSMGISFLLMLLPLPVVFIFLWRKRSLPVNSFFSGAAVFVVFYLVLRYYLLSSLRGSSVLSLFLSALIVEGGRLVGLFILPRREENLSLKTGLSLALGYMTAAFLLINAFEMAMNLVYAAALEGWGMAADYLYRFPSESVDRVQSLILQTPAYTYLLELLSLYLAVPVQLCLSLLAFQSFRDRRGGASRWFWWGGAVLLDAFYFGVGSAVASYGWAGHLSFLILTGAAALFVLALFWKEEIVDTLRAS
ncbi:MAG: YhfC family glutamic-type intramembrane protease [Spirochaetales bacterium]|nr:YhfC family glutamic-type intramembrane protease [Spirochaetales bacterium]